MAVANFPVLQFMWALTHKTDFLSTFSDRMQAEFFPNPVERLLVSWSTDHFQRHNEVITEAAIENLLEENEAELEEQGISDQDLWSLYDHLEKIRSSEKHFVWNQAERFCKYQAIKLGATAALKLLKDGDEAGAATALRRASNQTTVEETRGVAMIGDRHTALKRIGERENSTDYIASGIPKLDGLMEGGLRGGEVAIYLSHTGGGKTMFLCQTAAMALLNGTEVVYYTLEVNYDEIWLRTMASATGATINDLRAYAKAADGDPEYVRMFKSKESPVNRIDKLVKRLKLTGNEGREVLIRDIVTRGANLGTIFSDFEKIKQEGRDPKLIIIDYADRLRSREKHERDHESQAEVFQELQAAAKEYDVGIWTASQSSRAGLNKANLSLQEIQGAFAKAFEASYVLAAGQSTRMALDHEYKFLMAKARRAGSTNYGFIVKYDFRLARFRATERVLDEEDADVSNDYADAMSYQPDENDDERFAREFAEEEERGKRKRKKNDDE